MRGERKEKWVGQQEVKTRKGRKSKELTTVPEGCSVGCREGFEDGCSDGCEVGWLVGSRDGCEVGCSVGCLDGCEVGWREGRLVGCSDGCILGCSVGCSDGWPKIDMYDNNQALNKLSQKEGIIRKEGRQWMLETLQQAEGKRNSNKMAHIETTLISGG